jgi:hypothetical protein
MCSLLILPMQARAHGYLAVPESRNALANSDYCPHCLNAGGVTQTSKHAKYPNSRHGVCGDPQDGPRNHEVGGKYYTGEITGSYKKGGLVDVATAISTYHKGAIEYRICRFAAGTERESLTDECFEKNVLRSPSETSYESRWSYIGTGPERGYDPPKLYYATRRLPEGLSCDGKKYRCVLQMHWITGNTCQSPSIPREHQLKHLQDCGDDLWPEEFWNCADIRII